MEEKDKQIDLKREKLEVGVYYEDKEYAGLTKRVIIIGVDIFTLVILWASIIIIWEMTNDDIEEIPVYLTYIGVSLAYIYLVVFRMFTVGTLGNILTKTKVVDLRGNRPSLFQMTIRFLMLILGPINFLLDFFWLTGDPYKQTLRDKFAATYVINKQAVPLGQGLQTFSTYQIFGMSFVFREVKKNNK